MPVRIGLHPIRRTLKYLESAKMILKDSIQVVAINVHDKGANHEGARQFVFWHQAQLQYKNPKVQVITMKNQTPTPFIRCFMENGKDLVVDVDNFSRDQIVKAIQGLVCKTSEQLAQEIKLQEVNPAYFGAECQRHCICECWGQVPCTGITHLPRVMTGRYRQYKTDDLWALRDEYLEKHGQKQQGEGEGGEGSTAAELAASESKPENTQPSA